MFEQIARVPGDAILGLIEAFNKDTNPQKVDLGVGVYRDANGNTPVMRAVKQAEDRLVENEVTKTYIGSHGDPRFGKVVLPMVLGRRVAAAGRQRVPAPLRRPAVPVPCVWRQTSSPATSRAVISGCPLRPGRIDLGIFDAAGVTRHSYPYVDENNRLDFDGMLATLKTIPEGDVVVLHACCHNPTGFDLSREQWDQVLEVVQSRKLLPLIDFAYQGFGDGLEEDAYGVRLLAENADEAIITSSCSKNFGIYGERTGCLILIAKDEDSMLDVRSRPRSPRVRTTPIRRHMAVR